MQLRIGSDPGENGVGSAVDSESAILYRKDRMV